VPTPESWYGEAERLRRITEPDPVREAYERGEIPMQAPCGCCQTWAPSGCAAVVRDLQTGPCSTSICKCYGSVSDGGLCEDCYVASK